MFLTAAAGFAAAFLWLALMAERPLRSGAAKPTSRQPTRRIGARLRRVAIGQVVCSVDALEHAAVDPPAAVGLLFHDVLGHDRHAVRADHQHPLGPAPFHRHEVAELDLLRAVDRLVAGADHRHEGVGILEDALDRRRSVGEGLRARCRP